MNQKSPIKTDAGPAHRSRLSSLSHSQRTVCKGLTLWKFPFSAALPSPLQNCTQWGYPGISKVDLNCFSLGWYLQTYKRRQALLPLPRVAWSAIGFASLHCSKAVQHSPIWLPNRSILRIHSPKFSAPCGTQLTAKLSRTGSKFLAQSYILICLCGWSQQGRDENSQLVPVQHQKQQDGLKFPSQFLCASKLNSRSG